MSRRFGFGFAAGRKKARNINKKKLTRAILILAACALVISAAVLLTLMNKPADYSAAIEPILEKGVLRIGLRTDIASMSVKNAQTGQFEGLEADICAEVAHRLLTDGIPIEYVPINTKSARLMVKNGEVDMALGCFFNDGASGIAYSPPYYMDALKFVPGQSGSVGETVAVVSSSYAGVDDNLENYFKTRDIDTQVKAFSSYPDAVDALSFNQVDSLCAGAALLPTFAPGKEPLPEAVLKHGYCVMTAASRKSLSGAVSEIIEKMKDDGTLDALAAKWGLASYWDLKS